MGARALVLLATLLLVGCGSGDPEPDTPAEPLATSSSTPTAVVPTTDVLASVEQFASIIARSEAGGSGDEIGDCWVKHDLTSALCAVVVELASVQAGQLVDDLDALGDPPEEVAKLTAETRAAAVVMRDQSSDYMVECPQAGATSSDCGPPLLLLSSYFGPDLADVFEGWQPYL